LRKRAWIAGLLSCLVAGLAGCERPSSEKPSPNVVLIVVDTARSDRFSCYGHSRPTTPSIDAFARDAVLYARARAPSPWTLPSHGALFTGLPPGAHGLHWSALPAVGDSLPPRLGKLAPSAEERLLARKLKALGYSTIGVSNNPWISIKSKLDLGFDRFVWRPAPKSGDQGRAERSLEIIRKHFEGKAPAEPFFVFLNLIEPHFPYDPSPGFHGMFGGNVANVPAGEDVELSMLAGALPIDPEVLSPLYDEELRCVDDVVGRLFDWLRERDDYRESLIVVTSDHGELLGEGGRYSHQLSVAEELIMIPLLVKYPGNDGAGRIEENPLVSLTDVWQTILRAAGGEGQDDEAWSQDLRAMDRFSREWTITEYFFAVRYLRQLARIHSGFDAAAHEVIQRVVFADGVAHVFEGDELRPVPDERTPPGASLPRGVLGEVSAYVQSRVPAVEADDTLGDEATVEALRSLGYVD
jgi:arylsulfatase A-like enzyme